MTEFVELRDREVTEQFIIRNEEHIRNYRITYITHNDMDTIWFFRDGELQGIFSWTGMLTFNEFKQVICYLPVPEPTLLFGQWEPELTATDADYAMVISTLTRNFNQLGAEARKDLAIFQGTTSYEFDDEFESVRVLLDDVPLIDFITSEEGQKLVTVETSSWYASPQFEQFWKEEIAQFLPEMAEAVHDELITLLPSDGDTIH